GRGAHVGRMAGKDASVARANPIGRRVLEGAGEGEGLRMWCLATDDIHAVAPRLGLEPHPWTRARPDGGELRWRLAGAERAMTDPSLPFFIQWDCPPAEHPSNGFVRHTIEVAGPAWLEVGGDAERIARWTDHAELPVRVIDADEGPRALSIATADGEVVLR